MLFKQFKYRVAKTFLNPFVQKSVHFQKKSVQSVQFSKNNPYNPYNFFLKNPYNPYIFLNQSVHFFKDPYIFFKNLYNQHNFRKNPIFEKKHIKIQFFIHCLLCSVHVRGFKLLQQESICKKLASYIYTN